MAIKKITLQNEDGEDLREIPMSRLLEELDHDRTYEVIWGHEDDANRRIVGDLQGCPAVEVQHAVSCIVRAKENYSNLVREHRPNKKEGMAYRGKNLTKDFYVFIRESGQSDLREAV